MIQNLINKLIDHPAYLKQGAPYLANKFKCSIQDIVTAKKQVKDKIKPIPENRIVKKIDSLYALSPKEIEAMVKVDNVTTYIARVWDKQLKDGSWTYSVDIRYRKINTDITDQIEKFIKNLKVQKAWLPKVPDKISETQEFLIMSLSDMHVDKRSYIDEKYDVFKVAFENACYLIDRAKKISNFSEVILILGNDFFNDDTYYHTTTKGTPQDTEGKSEEVFYNALTFTSQLINMILKNNKKLTVYSPKGNHDSTKSQFLQAAIKKIYENVKNINVILDSKDRQYFERGDNVFMLTHGDSLNFKNMPMVFATEMAKGWVKSNKTILCGHWHKKQELSFISTTETNGVDIKICPSLSKTDKWHYENGFIGGKRRSVAYLYSKKFGELDTFYTKCL